MLPSEFWRALLVFTTLKVARFSEAFVTLHANAVGLPAAYLPMLIIGIPLCVAVVFSGRQTAARPEHEKTPFLS